MTQPDYFDVETRYKIALALASPNFETEPGDYFPYANRTIIKESDGVWGVYEQGAEGEPAEDRDPPIGRINFDEDTPRRGIFAMIEAFVDPRYRATRFSIVEEDQ